MILISIPIKLLMNQQSHVCLTFVILAELFNKIHFNADSDIMKPVLILYGNYAANAPNAPKSDSGGNSRLGCI